MKDLFLKLTGCILIVTIISSCNRKESKILHAIQGKWYNTDGTEKIIEVTGDKWIEGEDTFGRMTCQISQYNDSITELKVIENNNTVTYFEPGMKLYIKVRFDFPPDILHFETTDTTGRRGHHCYFTTNKAKIRPYTPRE